MRSVSTVMMFDNIIRPKRKKIKVFWWNTFPNFGDTITPELFKIYGFEPEWSEIKDADVVSTGSILSMVHEDYAGIILGSGLISDRWDLKFPSAKILALRGEETRKRIGLSQPVVLGDPGLLADGLLKSRKKKKKRIGIIPHYIDKTDERIKQIGEKHKKQVRIIDIQQKPLKVIAEIDACEYILSSSLHGLIAADSLGIPSGWIELSDNVIGKGFKFNDYNSAISSSHIPFRITGGETVDELTTMARPVPQKVEEVKMQLHHLFKNL